MFQTLKNAWKITELRKKILYTLFMLLIYRVLCFIPTPGVDTSVIASALERFSLLGFINQMTGADLANYSIMAMEMCIRDRPTTAKIAPIKKSDAIFASGVSNPASCGHLRPCKLPWRQDCFLGVDLPSPTGSSNPVARLQAQRLASRRRRPFLTIKDRQKRLGDKFCRRQNFLACGLSQRSASLLTLSIS